MSEYQSAPTQLVLACTGPFPPGGNVTGLTNFAEDLAAKQLDLVRELPPHLARVAVLINIAKPVHQLCCSGALLARVPVAEAVHSIRNGHTASLQTE